MRYDAYCFDLDGTLIDSSTGIFASVRHALRAIGRQDIPGDDVLCRFIGPPLRLSFVGILGMDDETADRAVVQYRAYYAQEGWKQNDVYVGLPQLLRTLKSLGRKLYVATAKPEVFALQILEHLDLARYFDGVRGISLSDYSGDKAAVIRSILPPETGPAVMVGDHTGDVRGAKETGLDSVAVGYGFGKEEDLLAAGPTVYVKDVAALCDELLEGHPSVPGSFLSVEGIDGSGKSTQAQNIARWLRHRGFDVLQTREPGGAPIAEAVRSLVLDPQMGEMCPETEALLYAAARAQHVRQVIRPAIAAGKTVLCDRYLDSSLAYQGAGRELGLEQVRKANEMAVGGTLPDLTLVFDLDARRAGERLRREREQDRIEREDLSFHERVAGAFQALIQAEPQRMCRVDAGGTPEETFAMAKQVLDAALRER